MPNKAFWRAVHCLAHPVSIAAVLILLFNDHWLRWQHPSWLTGKLGDVTWLIFAPFIVALLFAWLIPPKINHHERRIGLISIGFIGTWFALAKTVPFFHQLTTSTLDALMGAPGSLRVDATDLLTLPALLISWYVWQHADNRAITARPIAYAAFGLGLLGTMANTPSAKYVPAPFDDAGITHICQWNNQLITMFPFGAPLEENAEPPIQTYVSADGGLTWTTTDNVMSYSEFQTNADCSAAGVLTDPANPAIQYHWQPDKAILRSHDGGQTWRVAYSLSKLTQEVRAYYQESHSAWSRNIKTSPAPIEGWLDRRTGNMLFTMGQNGVLVRTPKGEYSWSQVGDYYLVNLAQVVRFDEVLRAHNYLFVMLGLLVLVTTAMFLRDTRAERGLLVASLWIAFIIATFVAKPYWEKEERFSILPTIPPTVLILFAIGLLLLPFVLGAIWDVARNFRAAVLPILVMAVLAIAAYAFPFLLWTTGSIARYYAAAILALILTGCTLAACYAHYLPRLPRASSLAFKTKRKNEDLPDAENLYRNV